MKELVEYIVKSLVDQPDDVRIVESQSRDRMILELSVAAPDMGRVIGKGGRIINAIRKLVQVAAAKQGRQVSLELIEVDDRR
ncbi:MAG: KH domain-containing protein [Candidatus Promineifilaceae bacterium]|nr:KH domain-containing protein [Candidatus Promineifilaceae bacterium]